MDNTTERLTKLREFAEMLREKKPTKEQIKFLVKEVARETGYTHAQVKQVIKLAGFIFG